MALRVLDRVPIDQIEAEAKPVDLGRLLKLLIVGLFYLLGFVARKVALMVGVVSAALGVGLGWAIAATMTGWREAGLPVEERRRARAA